METIDVLNVAIKALDDKKAIDIQAVKVTDLTIIADYFLIASGSSSTQVKALAQEVEHKLKEEHNLLVSNIEGRSSNWILLDYGSVIVHIFHTQAREYYNLERLWNDGKIVDVNSILAGEANVL